MRCTNQQYLVELTLPTTLISIGTCAFADGTALPARILAFPPLHSGQAFMFAVSV